MITDIQMGSMSGLELINIVNERYPEIRIIVLTGYDEFEYARKCLRMNVVDFLLKPVDEDDMADLIRKQTEGLDVQQKQQKLAGVMRRIIGSNEQGQLNQMMCELVSHQEQAFGNSSENL